MTEKWSELSTYDTGFIVMIFIYPCNRITFDQCSDLSQYRPVYAPKDFLDVLLWIRSPNHRSLE